MAPEPLSDIEKQWAMTAVNIALRATTDRKLSEAALRNVARTYPAAIEKKIHQLKTMIAVLERHLPIEGGSDRG